jgi:hypothetical protein
MGSKTGLDAVEKRKIPSPRRESNPRTPIIQPVASRYTDERYPPTFMEPNISLPWTKDPSLDINLNQINPFHTPFSIKSILILFSYLRLGLLSGLFPLVFTSKILYAFLVFHRFLEVILYFVMISGLLHIKPPKRDTTPRGHLYMVSFQTESYLPEPVSMLPLGALSHDTAQLGHTFLSCCIHLIMSPCPDKLPHSGSFTCVINSVIYIQLTLHAQKKVVFSYPEAFSFIWLIAITNQRTCLIEFCLYVEAMHYTFQSDWCKCGI